MTNSKRNRQILVIIFTVFFFSPQGRAEQNKQPQHINPFTPFWHTASHQLQETGTIRTLRPQQLQLLGIAWAESNPKNVCILVELPGGKSALLHPQSLIGPYQGKITEIQDQSVSIVENVPNLLGQTEKKLTILTLSAPEAEHE